jgi:hypothetical protein
VQRANYGAQIAHLRISRFPDAQLRIRGLVFSTKLKANFVASHHPGMTLINSVPIAAPVAVAVVVTVAARARNAENAVDCTNGTADTGTDGATDR